MKLKKVMAWLVVSLVLATSAFAQEPRPSSPKVVFEILPRQDTYYVGQRVTARLSIDFDEAELSSQIGTEGLPDGNTAQMSEFSRVNTGNPNKLAYTASLIILKQGLNIFAPTLSGQMAVRVKSSGFFSNRRIYSFSSQSAPVEMNVKVPPETGRPDNYCGAVGEYTLDAELAPRTCMVGDLLTLKWTLGGNGTADDVTKVEYKPGKDFRVYPPRVTSQADGVVSCSQVIIPLSTNVTSAAAFKLSVFDPVKGEYKELSSGPFSLRVGVRVISETPTNTLSKLVYRTEPEETQQQGLTNGNGWMRFLHRKRGETALLSVSASARLCPDAVSRILFEIPAGSSIEVRERYGDWARVLHDGAAGWIPSVVLGQGARSREKGY